MRFSFFPRWRGLGSALLLWVLVAGTAHAQLPDTLDLRPTKYNELVSHIVVGRPVPPIVRFRIRNLSPGSIYGQYTMRCRVDANPSHDTAVWVGIPGGGTSPAPDFYFQLRNLPVGRHTVRVWLDAPAGTIDPNPANDTLRYVVRVVPAAQSTRRRALVEEFTATTCLPCGTYAPFIAQWLADAPQDTAALTVAYQQDFPAPGCFYQNPSSIAQRVAAGINAVPTFRVNGARPVFMPWAGSNPLIDEMYDPAFVTLDATYTRDSLTGQFTVWPIVTPLAEFEPSQLRPSISVAWVEPEVPAVHAINGQTTFHHVSHFVETNWPTTPLTLGTVGVPVVVPPATYTPDTADHVVNVATLVPIVWLRSAFATDGVLQAVRARPLGSPLGGTAPAVRAFGFSLAPNPAHGLTRLHLTLPTAQLVAVEVVDALGRRALSPPATAHAPGQLALPLDVRGLPAGVYAVRLTAGNQTLTRRLVVE